GMVCVVGRMRDLILQLSKSSIYSTKPMSTSICGSHISYQGSEASFVSNGLKEEALDLIMKSEILSI
ncbi:hypothetical protein ABN272_20770, partial [Escherichia coli]